MKTYAYSEHVTGNSFIGTKIAWTLDLKTGDRIDRTLITIDI